MDPTEFINKGYTISDNGFRDMLKMLIGKLKDKRNKNFIQDFNFSKNGKVIHAHIYFLEWLYGAVYRKRVQHFFLLYDFEVQKHELRSEHKEALTDFFEQIFLDELIKNSNLDAREFENYKNPFITNIKKDKKEMLIDTQLWGPENFASATRENEVRIQLLKSFKASGNATTWWENNNIAFPDVQNQTDLTQDGNHPHYPPFKVSDLLYWRQSPGVTENFSTFIGRSSETGTDSINDPLSVKRAQSVIDFLNEKLGELNDYVENANLGLNAIGSGSDDPIILDENELEISENRSVQFSFFQAHDYVHLLTPEQLKSQYRTTVHNINEDLKEKIVYMENYMLNPQPPFNLPGINQGSLMEGLKYWDQKYSLGMNSIFFVKQFDGDFQNLNNNPHIPDTPTGINLSHHQISSPEGHSVSNVLPMVDIISRGEFSTRNTAKFKMPLSPDKRMDYAIKTFKEIVKILVTKYSSDTSPSITAENYLDYYKVYTQSALIANSFLMTKLSKDDFKEKIKDNTWKFRLDFTGDNSIYKNRFGDDIVDLEIYMADPGFMENSFLNSGFIDKINDEIDRGVISNFYWFNTDVKKNHFAMRKILAKNIVKTVVLASQTEILTYYSGLGSLGKPFFIPPIAASFPDLTYSWILPSIGEADW